MADFMARHDYTGCLLVMLHAARADDTSPLSQFGRENLVSADASPRESETNRDDRFD